MIKIDGSRGEGGGQILRSSLTLSMVTGQPVTIDNIRSGRKKPGLMRQHLTCVRAAAEICGAKISGAELGSARVVFNPGEIGAGDYKFAVGTAGGTGLVFQTLFPALLIAERASTLQIEGGTHNKAAPSFEFLRDSFLSALSTMGIVANVELVRPGFYPAGGGQIQASISPSDLDRKLDLTERGDLIGLSAKAVVSNLSDKIAQREISSFANNVVDLSVESEIEDWPSAGPGNVLLATLRFAGHTDVFSGFGEFGVKAETVGKRVAGEVRAHAESDAVVGVHLADQLLLPLAIGSGGRFTTPELTPHFKTNVETIGAFLDVSVRTEQLGERLYLVEVG